VPCREGAVDAGREVGGEAHGVLPSDESFRRTEWHAVYRHEQNV
jgi:hypothetical protein